MTALGFSEIVGLLRTAGCVFAEDEAALIVAEARDESELSAWLMRRVAGEPLETILGWAGFAGLRIAVSTGVFVPRQRSLLLVREAARAAPENALVVELCCGGAALAARRPDLRLHATDIDDAALQVARRNLAGLGAVSRGDLYSGLDPALRGAVHVLVANAPYVPTAEVALMPPEARDHEPLRALDGGADGLDLHRRIVAEAPTWLLGGGALILETSTRQAPLDVEMMAAAGLAARIVGDDDLDATAVIGVKH